MPTEQLLGTLQGLEESLLVPHVRKSAQLTELLAEDFIEFGSSGRVYTRADLVDVLQEEQPVTQTTSDFRVLLLAPNVALLTYRIHRHTDPPVHTLRCSAWRMSDGRWQMVFHQATVTTASR